MNISGVEHNVGLEPTTMFGIVVVIIFITFLIYGLYLLLGN